MEGRRIVLVVRPGIRSFLSPFHKWLVKDSGSLHFLCPALVLTGRVVPVSERGLKTTEEESRFWAGEDSAACLEDLEEALE